jgi:predicted P-loop ATPase
MKTIAQKQLQFQSTKSGIPCPHCGKEDWCYSVGELTVCKRKEKPAQGWYKTSKKDKEDDYFYAPKVDKKQREKCITEYFYEDIDLSEAIKVTRYDYGNGKKKSFSQSSITEKGDWKKGFDNKYKNRLVLYRYRKVREAIKRKEKIFFVEGEGTADALWRLGIPATTSIGGSGKYRSYSNYLENCPEMRQAEIILCPDRDEPGLKYMEDIAKDFPNAKWLYAPPNDFYWLHLPKSEGLDVQDWIENGATAEQIYEAIEERRILVDKLDENYRAPDAEKPKITRSKRKQLQNLLNAQWGDSLRYNQMSLEIEKDGITIETDTISDYIADFYDMDVSQDSATGTLYYLAKNNAYHPVKEYLEKISTVHKDTSILNDLATRYFGTEDPIYNIFLRKCLLAAVWRIFEPGCKFDNVLVLQGKQGLYKSSFWKHLCPQGEWFDDNGISTNEKDDKLKLRRFWILELAEIESVFKSKEVASFRGFLTSEADNIRVPYGRVMKRFPRTSIFVGSANPDEFLVDPEGNRRYWIIPVEKKIPVFQLEDEKDKIWAAAVALYRQGEKPRLSAEEEARVTVLNRQYEIADTWEENIELYLKTKNKISISEILTDCLKFEISKQDRVAQMRVSTCLKKIGWRKAKRENTSSGAKSFFWVKEVCPDETVVNQQVQQSTQELDIPFLENSQLHQQDSKIDHRETEGKAIALSQPHQGLEVCPDETVDLQGFQTSTQQVDIPFLEKSPVKQQDSKIDHRETEGKAIALSQPHQGLEVCPDETVDLQGFQTSTQQVDIPFLEKSPVKQQDSKIDHREVAGKAIAFEIPFKEQKIRQHLKGMTGDWIIQTTVKQEQTITVLTDTRGEQFEITCKTHTRENLKKFIEFSIQKLECDVLSNKKALFTVSTLDVEIESWVDIQDCTLKDFPKAIHEVWFTFIAPDGKILRVQITEFFLQ